MSEDVHVIGLKELQKFLDQLAPKMEANIMRSALRQGANDIKTEAQNQLSAHGNIETGLLKKGLKVSTNLKRGVVTASIKAKGKHGYLAHWIEYGVMPHGIKKGAKRKSGKYQDGKLNPGFKEKPFMRPALDIKAAQALLTVGETIKKRLTKAGINTPDVELEIEL